jgi:probable rRNA maturation factor
VDKPTDVLAFGFSKAKTLHSKTSVLEYKPLSLSNLLGEIIISLDAVRRQAKEYKHSFEKELTILLIHGVLHILGYDHSDDNLPQEPMAIRTNKILEKITDRIIYDAGVK